MIATQRGDIVVLADRSGRYTSKPRPARVLQADAFPGTDSVLVCLITSTERDAPLLRVAVPSNEQTGLRLPSWVQLAGVQLEKLTAVARDQIGQRIGASDGVLLDVARKLMVVLGIG
jgi:mRNA interferase MazF